MDPQRFAIGRPVKPGYRSGREIRKLAHLRPVRGLPPDGSDALVCDRISHAFAIGRELEELAGPRIDALNPQGSV